GQSDTHLSALSDSLSSGIRVHQDVLDPFIQLQDAARDQGFDIAVLSGFRSFEQQLSIWNRKATGMLAVLDGAARPLDVTQLKEEELVFAILRWSALPGASRHHWGTDLDIYDMAAKPEGYEVELMPNEVDAGGMFAPLHEWLDRRMAERDAYGFFRPYDVDRGGIAPERWHISHASVAAICEGMLTRDLLRETIARADMRLKEVVLAHLDLIYDRFVTNINRP
ncbi:MAG TPA: M15 family metallopeptidase, partial [Gemmatimonadaceae bacterium]|nr:M15 family metallopeptidase [Gemmatimonadaceae bacterium]